jgi:hypothetical protein
MEFITVDDIDTICGYLCDSDDPNNGTTSELDKAILDTMVLE